jgi:DNA-binding transcriptional MerR regulator
MQDELIAVLPSENKSSSALRTIGEVAQIIDVPQHVLRFWESKFPQLQPLKSKGRRYYNLKDIETLRKIKSLLYKEGFTIRGVQNYLSSNLHKASKNPKLKDQECLEHLSNVMLGLTECRDKLSALLELE